MSIFKNIKKAHAAVSVDLVKGNPPTLGKQFSNAAVAAITRGLGSPEWKSYMSLFADNAGQLERLTVQKQGEQDYLPLFRAYVVSNSVCDITTNTNTINRIDEAIDDPAMSEAPDGTIVRPFQVPDV
jgi:hypothetical protein